MPLVPPGSAAAVRRLARQRPRRAAVHRPLDAQSAIRIRNPQSDMVTPNDRFYVRTAARRRPPPSRPRGSPPRCSGAAGSDGSPAIDFARLERTPGRVRAGPYLMECARQFGPDQLRPDERRRRGRAFPMAGSHRAAVEATSGARILVNGCGSHGPVGDLSRGRELDLFARAIWNTRCWRVQMNDAPLPRRSRWRLRSRWSCPGWCGCACIKWVDRIELVADEAPATIADAGVRGADAQPTACDRRQPVAPREISSRPIDRHRGDAGARREMARRRARSNAGSPGIIWGGSRPTSALSIRFKSRPSPWVRVERLPAAGVDAARGVCGRTPWRPERQGDIKSSCASTIRRSRTRRLDIFFYVREIRLASLTTSAQNSRKSRRDQTCRFLRFRRLSSSMPSFSCA